MMRRALAIPLLLAAACGEPQPCTDVQALLDGPEGLILTEEDHPLGWGEAQCFACHQAWNIHQPECVEQSGWDAEFIDEHTDVEDSSSCAACHGDNGQDEEDAVSGASKWVW